MLGIRYTTAIDMWSTGCILAELFTGNPLFPGKDEPEQMAMIMEVNGIPSKKMLEKASRVSVFFDNNGLPLTIKNADGDIRKPGSKSLSSFIKSENLEFVDFIQKCLTLDPEERMTPDQAKSHPWLASNKIGRAHVGTPVTDH